MKEKTILSMELRHKSWHGFGLDIAGDLGLAAVQEKDSLTQSDCLVLVLGSSPSRKQPEYKQSLD